MEQLRQNSEQAKTPDLNESLAFAVMSHVTQVLKDSEASISSVYLPAERFLQGISERLIQNDEFIRKVADVVVSRSSLDRSRRTFYKLKEVAEILNKHPKSFSRVAEEQYGLEKVYIGNEVNFRADQVEQLVAELKGNLVSSLGKPKAA